MTLSYRYGFMKESIKKCKERWGNGWKNQYLNLVKSVPPNSDPDLWPLCVLSVWAHPLPMALDPFLVLSAWHPLLWLVSGIGPSSPLPTLPKTSFSGLWSWYVGSERNNELEFQAGIAVLDFQAGMIPNLCRSFVSGRDSQTWKHPNKTWPESLRSSIKSIL